MSREVRCQTAQSAARTASADTSSHVEEAHAIAARAARGPRCCTDGATDMDIPEPRPGTDHEKAALDALTALIERAVLEAQAAGGHYHVGRSRSTCGSPDCLGKHPLLAIASACRRAAKPCKDQIKHVHVWTDFAGLVYCGVCGQTKYEVDTEEEEDAA